MAKNSAGAASRTRGLTPWPKGVSGNPAGRPKGAVNISQRVQRILEGEEKLPANIKKMIEELYGPKADRAAVDAVVLSLLVGALRGDARAAKELFDRGYGKVAEPVELSGPDGGPIETESKVDVASLPDALVAAVAEALRKAG